MMDGLFYGFAVLLFAAAVLAVEGAWLWWTNKHGSAARRIARRLTLMSPGASGAPERVSILKQRRYAANGTLDRLLRRVPRIELLDRLLVQGGVEWSIARLLALSLGAWCVGAVLARAWQLPLTAMWLLATVAAAVPVMLLMRARAQRMRHIEEQLPEAADFIARALRAGHSFTNVLHMAGAELPEPLSGEFRIAHEEINYGVPMNEALQHLAARIPLTDLRYLVIAVLIQRESGGNLAEIMGNISRIIRSRLHLLGQVRVLSAEGRLSAWILGMLPFAVAGLMAVTNRPYISVLWTDEAGRRLVGYALTMLAFGALWLRSVARIRV